MSVRHVVWEQVSVLWDEAGTGHGTGSLKVGTRLVWAEDGRELGALEPRKRGPGRGEMEGVGHGRADPAECVVSPAAGRTGKRWSFSSGVKWCDGRRKGLVWLLVGTRV